MKTPGMYFLFMAILPLIVIGILYTYLPFGEAGIKGNIMGVTLMAGGPLAGYIIILLIYKNVIVSLDIFGLSAMLEEKKRIVGDWKVESKSFEHGTVLNGILCFKLSNGKLSMSGTLLDKEGNLAVGVASQACEFNDKGELFLAYDMDDSVHKKKYDGFSKLHVQHKNEIMDGNWSAASDNEIKHGQIKYTRVKT